jgi:hypothetical protein
MAHRLCNFELSPEKFAREKATTIEIGRTNGNPAQNMSKIINKQVRNTEHRSITTLSPIEVKKRNVYQSHFILASPTKLKKSANDTTLNW